jgi:lipoprotein-anchoring transpeptidase ErfK/SrfK
MVVYADATTASAMFTLTNVTDLGTPRVLLATARTTARVRVLLPTRPNGAQGWVPAEDVALTNDPDTIDVDLATRTLTWSRDGEVMEQVTVGIGAPSTPTPTGTFFVTDVLPEDPGGAYGAWLIALNAHSDAFTVFEGGDPRIAIHGTNNPSTIGAALSNGCVHVSSAPLAALAADIAPGTPVLIH